MRNKETDMTLEKRIETAIAENTDPFTTDADIRFFETEEWNTANEYVPTENIKEGLLVVYIHGYGKNKTEYIGEFKGYEGNKVRIGRWEFKDAVVLKERLLGVFHKPKDGVEMGVDNG
jgi:hypothetical protein